MYKFQRAVHLDFHNMPGIPDFGNDFNPGEFARTLADAHVGWITFFARCNIGYSYYETATGLKYPGCRHDMLGEVIQACHALGIGVAAYLNAGLDHAFADLHREWTVLNKDGTELTGDRTGNFFRSMCFNTPYRGHLRAEILEVLAQYPGIDGFFFDCMGDFPCYCPACMDAMKLAGVDTKEDDQVKLYFARLRGQVADEIRALLPEGKTLFFNGSFLSGSPFPGMAPARTHQEIECLPTAPDWGYDTFPAAVAYTRGLLKQIVFMTGRFQTEWGDFGGLRPGPAMEFDCFYALAQGAVCSIGDQLHPRGVLEPAVYEEIGKIYRQVEAVEPWTADAKGIADIGVLFPLDHTRPMESQKELQTALTAAARILCELKYQFDILDDTFDLAGYRVIILPDCIRLSDTLAIKLNTYIRFGGKVLSSGTSGLREKMLSNVTPGLREKASNKNFGPAPEEDSFASKYWPFVCEGPDTWDNGYFTVDPANLPGIAKMPLAIYTPGILLGADGPFEVIADYWKPYFNRHWDGHQGYFYIPYDQPTGQAAIVRTASVTHVCFPIFSSYLSTMAIAYKQILAGLLRHMLPDPLVKTDLPSFARVGLTRKAPYTLLHLLAYCPEYRATRPALEEPIRLPDIDIQVKMGHMPGQVYLLPDRLPVSYTYSQGYVQLKLPTIEGHAIVVLEDSPDSSSLEGEYQND